MRYLDSWSFSALAPFAVFGAVLGSGALLISPSASAGDSYRERLELLSLVDALDAAVFEVVGADRVGWFDENEDGARDEIGDVYFYDHDGDGEVDRVVDWTDLDGDGTADRQLLVYLTPGILGQDLSAFVIESRGGPSEFWHTVRGEYVQSLSQYRSDFHGDLFFSAIRWDPSRGEWAGFDENPFCFYDPDGDGRSEEALRVSGVGLLVHSLRWSFDTDDDGPGRAESSASPKEERLRQPSAGTPIGAETPGQAETPTPMPTPTDTESYAHAYDYDLSLTGILRSRTHGADVDTLVLRAGTELPILDWAHARTWAASQNWYRIVLTFDENDRNIDPADLRERDRWEGVIASPPDGFPAVGSPTSGRMNKRFEQRDGLPGPPELYFHPVDGRIHLRNAFRSWIDIDRDLDGIPECRLEIEDRDGDGVFDTWFWDGDGDGSFEHVYRAPETVEVEPIPIDFRSLNGVEAHMLALTGLPQADRFEAEVRAWTVAGRFVPIDSIAAR